MREEKRIVVETEFLNAIDSVAQKLGVAADKILPIYVRQVRINATAMIVADVLLSAAIWLLFLIPLGTQPTPNEYQFYRHSTADDFAVVLGFARWATCIITSSVSLYSAVARVEDIAVPEATAFARLFKHVRGA